MRIAMVVAGAGSMYCGACARDGHLARALAAAGNDVSVFPIYTPLRLEEELGVHQEPLNIGGINAYLRERFPRMPKFLAPLNGWLDNPKLLNWVSQFAVRTQAAELGQMTVSFLNGEKGPHVSDIMKLAMSVAEFQPDAVILANTLLAGLIAPIAQTSGVPVICQVQGEDGFLNELPDPWRSHSIDLLRQKIKSSPALMAPCQVHADEMASLLELPIARFSIVPPSVQMAPTKAADSDGSPVRIGHLSSIRWVKGLDILVRAFAGLHDLPIEFAVRGKVLEPEFFRRVRSQADIDGVEFEFGGEASPFEKADFLAECDFIVLPSRLHESRGIVALESLACGTPVIAPSRGIFPEIAEATGGIALYSTDEQLDETIRQCISDREIWCERGIQAAEKVAHLYSAAGSAAAAAACLDRACAR